MSNAAAALDSGKLWDYLTRGDAVTQFGEGRNTSPLLQLAHISLPLLYFGEEALGFDGSSSVATSGDYTQYNTGQLLFPIKWHEINDAIGMKRVAGTVRNCR